MPLKVCETFKSIQGESTYMGLPCFFIRLTGCNLRCTYCDTIYAFNEGKYVALEELLEMTEGSGCRIVEITGGEPLLQEETPLLVSQLCDRGYSVLVETNGSCDIDLIDRRAVRVVDMKTPGSGMADRMDLNNLKKLTDRDELKFVITSRTDYNWAKEMVLGYGLQGERTHFCPATGTLSPESLSQWILKDGLFVRLSIQLHKYIFGERRGV